MPSRSSINLFVGGINKSLVVVLNPLFMFILKVNSYSLTKKRYDYYDPCFTNKEKKNSTFPHVCVHMCSVAQSCPILCDLMDCSLPASSVHGIF